MGAKAEAAKMTAAATAANRRTSSLLSCHEDRVSYRYRSSLGAAPTPDASERRTEGGTLGTRRRVCRLYHHAAQLFGAFADLTGTTLARGLWLPGQVPAQRPHGDR